MSWLPTYPSHSSYLGDSGTNHNNFIADLPYVHWLDPNFESRRMMIILIDAQNKANQKKTRGTWTKWSWKTKRKLGKVYAFFYGNLLQLYIGTFLLTIVLVGKLFAPVRRLTT